jgi:hypothetical protein
MLRAKLIINWLIFFLVEKNRKDREAVYSVPPNEILF